MPDDYADEDPIAVAKAWVEEHPGLAVLGAAGIGLLAGRLVMALIPDPDPPSLADRVETRARQIAKEAKKRGEVYSKEAKKRGKVYSKDAAAFADDAGDTLQASLHKASEALKEAADRAGDAAEAGYEKSKDLAETIADAAKVAVTGVLAAKLDDWVGKVRS
jgi:gas vesicle protein